MDPECFPPFQLFHFLVKVLAELMAELVGLVAASVQLILYSVRAQGFILGLHEKFKDGPRDIDELSAQVKLLLEHTRLMGTDVDQAILVEAHRQQCIRRLTRNQKRLDKLSGSAKNERITYLRRLQMAVLMKLKEKELAILEREVHEDSVFSILLAQAYGSGFISMVCWLFWIRASSSSLMREANWSKDECQGLLYFRIYALAERSLLLDSLVLHVQQDRSGITQAKDFPSRNTRFVGRAEIIDIAMQDLLIGDSQNRVALVGLGGTG